MPRQFMNQGDRLAFSNGIVGLSVFAGILLVAFGGDTHAYAFTSCARFSGRFQIRDSTVQAIVDCEGLTIEPGGSWPLEELMVASGSDRSALLNQVAARLAKNHKVARPFRGRGRGDAPSTPPTGWCSWYCFGPNVTAQQVLDNLDVIAKAMPSLKYIQIDDGYQPAMGDWLETGAAFGGSVRTVLAWPSPSVTALVCERVPPPPLTANETVPPTTGLLLASRSWTWRAGTPLPAFVRPGTESGPYRLNRPPSPSPPAKRPLPRP